MKTLRRGGCALLSLGLAACTQSAAKAPEASSEPAEAAPAEVAPAAAAEAPEAAELTTREDDSERASKNGRLEGELGGVPVVVEYGRPQTKGRAIFGGLVPYGEVWRTGADEATTVRFEAPARIGETTVEPGTYALFTIPGEKSWTFILNRVARQWGAYKYDEKADVVRVSAKPSKAEMTEVLSFETDGNRLVMKWADVAVGLPIEAPEKK